MPSSTPDSGAPAPDHEADDVEQRQATIRRAPKYGVFMTLAGGAGAAAGFIATQLTPPDLEADVQVDLTQLSIFVALIGAVAGVFLGGLLALILDRTVGRKTHTITVERVRHHTPTAIDEASADGQDDVATEDDETDAGDETHVGDETDAGDETHVGDETAVAGEQVAADGTASADAPSRDDETARD